VRAVVVAIALCALACGAAPRKHKTNHRDETAAEYQRRKAKEAGELDDDSDAGKWGGWKYQGNRDDCRFVLGRKCFTKRDEACKAAKCGGKTPKCAVDGGGPAIVSCAKT
jgi:hypothetical protein